MSALSNLSTIQLLSILARRAITEEELERPLLKILREVTPETHPVFLVAGEVALRALRQDIQGKPYFATPEAVTDYLKLLLGGYNYEVFVVLYLDAANRLIDVQELFRGTLTQTSVYPREIVIEALKRKSAAVILAHNHPSGTPTPSRADEAMTQVVRAALTLVDIRVLDHLIVAKIGSM
jgi:DNA repair protein RadC